MIRSKEVVHTQSLRKAQVTIYFDYFINRKLVHVEDDGRCHMDCVALQHDGHILFLLNHGRRIQSKQHKTVRKKCILINIDMITKLKKKLPFPMN